MINNNQDDHDVAMWKEYCEKNDVGFQENAASHCIVWATETRGGTLLQCISSGKKDIKPQKDWNIMKFKQRSQKINPERGKTCFWWRKYKKGQKNTRARKDKRIKIPKSSPPRKPDKMHTMSSYPMLESQQPQEIHFTFCIIRSVYSSIIHYKSLFLQGT